MIFGILSAIFLAIHSILLGLETDIKIFKFLRRVVLLSFIIFEIIAQGSLVYNFFKSKEQLNNFFNSFFLKLKEVIFNTIIKECLTNFDVFY